MHDEINIVAIVRTRGEAPYLKSVISKVIESGISVFLVDNNPKPIWKNLEGDRVDYFHDRKTYIPMCTKTFKDVCYGKDNELCIAKMYNNAFDQSRYPGYWLLKLDDDDLWMPQSLNRLKETVVFAPETGLIYFSGVNLLSESHISEGLTFCGGRDHFCIGPKVNFRFINGEQWELALFKGVTQKKYLGLSYAHLKFFGKSSGYIKDIEDSSHKYLSELEELTRKPIPIAYLKSFKLRILGYFFNKFPALAKNSNLGMVRAYQFYNELSESFLIKSKDE